MAKPPAFITMLSDAIAYPFARFGWWLIMTACSVGLMSLLWFKTISIEGVFVLAALAGLIVRCYLTIIENTITGYGSEGWQNDGLRADGMYADLANMFGVSAASWGPVLLGLWYIPEAMNWKDAALTLLTGLGCEYFCMAVTGLVVMGGTVGAGPILVIPAIWKSGGGYALASIVLMLVPWSFMTGLHAFGSGFESHLLGSIAAAAAAAFVLIMQARLIGLVYLQNKEHIGWE